ALHDIRYLSNTTLINGNLSYSAKKIKAGMMRKIALIAAAAALLITGCRSATPFSDVFDARPNAGPCPPAGSLYDASRIVVLDGQGLTFSNIEYTGEMVDVRLFCRYAASDPVRAEIEIDFAFGRGPKGEETRRDYTYWVAVTRRSGKVLNKAFFTTSADFRDGPVTGSTEVIQSIRIPRADDTISAANFEIVIGFELTEDQLTFNKEGRRFRLDAGQ
ncbi:MAG: hypothetical protein AAGG45_10355, partial [Pseudomonadota bacterium]